MSDGDALLRAILDSPDDDAPRLVYADWLEEHCDLARASFIRAQIQLTRLPDNDPDRDRLVQTEITLWHANREVWSAWVPRWARFERFRRGFLEKIQCGAGDFLAAVDVVRSQTPLAAVRLDGAGEFALPLFRSRTLDGLRSLTLAIGVVQQGTWEHLFASPYLSRLTELDLRSNAHANELVEGLISSTTLPALKTLRLKWLGLGDDHAPRLVEHRWVARLRALDMGNNHITVTGAAAILETPFLAEIEYLNLRGNPLAEHRPTVTALRQRFGARVWV
jgi:uncharacterized protein (TIGR02996 family)